MRGKTGPLPARVAAIASAQHGIATRTQLQRDIDNARDVALARAGYIVRRYSSAALADRQAVAHEILAIPAERGFLSAAAGTQSA